MRLGLPPDFRRPSEDFVGGAIAVCCASTDLFLVFATYERERCTLLDASRWLRRGRRSVELRRNWHEKRGPFFFLPVIAVLLYLRRQWGLLMPGMLQDQGVGGNGVCLILRAGNVVRCGAVGSRPSKGLNFFA